MALFLPKMKFRYPHRLDCGHFEYWLNNGQCGGCAAKVPLTAVSKTERWWKNASEAQRAGVRNPVEGT